MTPENPFDDTPPGPRRINPFGEEPETEAPGDAAARVEQGARRIRGLRSRIGSEGLTPAATRELIEAVAAALDATARALRGLEAED